MTINKVPAILTQNSTLARKLVFWVDLVYRAFLCDIIAAILEGIKTIHFLSSGKKDLFSCKTVSLFQPSNMAAVKTLYSLINRCQAMIFVRDSLHIVSLLRHEDGGKMIDLTCLSDFEATANFKSLFTEPARVKPQYMSKYNTQLQLQLVIKHRILLRNEDFTDLYKRINRRNQQH